MREHALTALRWWLAPLAIATMCTVTGRALEETPPAAPDATRLDAATRGAVAERLAQVLAEQYAVADQGAKLAEAILARLQGGAYDSIARPSAFARTLQADIHAIVNDRHVQVSFGTQPVPVARSSESPAEIAAQMRKQNAAIPQVRILDGNIGYLVVNAMLPLPVAHDVIAAAFAFLHNTDALIIDLRMNLGGDPGSVGLLEGYLSEGPPYLTNTVHWRKENRVQEFWTTDVGDLSYGVAKPTFVLTSRSTFSAAEQFAYDLQARGRAVIVGDTTGGGPIRLAKVGWWSWGTGSGPPSPQATSSTPSPAPTGRE